MSTPRFERVSGLEIRLLLLPWLLNHTRSFCAHLQYLADNLALLCQKPQKTLPIVIHMKTRGFGVSSVHFTGLGVLYSMAAQSRLLATQTLISLGVTICRTAVVVAKRAFPA